MNCNPTSKAPGEWICTECGFFDSIPPGIDLKRITRVCGIRPKPARKKVDLPSTIHASCGERLHRILKSIGFDFRPSCYCHSRMLRMNMWGPSGCRKNIPTIIGWLREEAEDRKFFDPPPDGGTLKEKIRAQAIIEAQRNFEENAKWLVNLAITLAEENREPNSVEQKWLSVAQFAIPQE